MPRLSLHRIKGLGLKRGAFGHAEHVVPSHMYTCLLEVGAALDEAHERRLGRLGAQQIQRLAQGARVHDLPHVRQHHGLHGIIQCQANRFIYLSKRRVFFIWNAQTKDEGHWKHVCTWLVHRKLYSH